MVTQEWRAGFITSFKVLNGRLPTQDEVREAYQRAEDEVREAYQRDAEEICTRCGAPATRRVIFTEDHHKIGDQWVPLKEWREVGVAWYCHEHVSTARFFDIE